MNVLFILAGDETRASTRFRVLNLLPALDDAGISYKTLSAKKFSKRLPGPDEIGYALFMGKLLACAPSCDIIFLQRVPLPCYYLKLLSRLCDHIVYDFDDAVYTAPQWENRKNQWRSLLDQTLQHSSQVIAGSPTLADYAQQHCDRVLCLPTPLPTDKYSSRDQISRPTSTKTVTLGWIGNPQNLHYLAWIEETVETVLDAHDHAELHVITAGDLPVAPLRDRPDVTYRTWTLDGELDLLSVVDIGIRPLFDDEWTRAKGGYTSVVQTMALGIPVVATPVGMITEIIDHGRTGYHADSAEEWTRYASELIEDEQKRREFGDRAHEAVGEQGFWLEQRAEEWVQVFRDLEQA